MRTRKSRGCSNEAPQFEHDTIESLLESLWKAVVSGASCTEVIEILNTAIDLCTTHLTGEEKIMRQSSHADVDGHVAAHIRLLTNLVAVRRSASGKGLSLAVLDALDLLDDIQKHEDRYDRMRLRLRPTRWISAGFEYRA